MFRMQSANLPPQQALLHADFLDNEQAYLRLRDSLLPRYAGQWMAVQGGQVIAAGDFTTVTDAAASAGGHPYVAQVGAEDEVTFRVRRIDFLGDARNLGPTRVVAPRSLASIRS